MAETRTCEVEGCDRLRHSAIHCGAHHVRLKVHGDVLAHVPIRRYGPPTPEEIAAVAYAPTPAAGHGFLWLV